MTFQDQVSVTGSTLMVLAVLGVGGVFGGIVNFFLAKPDDIPAPNVWRSIIIGTAASFLVPLFLNMISSTLIDSIKSVSDLKLLVLLGFCLVASISSTAFIKTLSDRVLNEAKKATRQADTARREISKVQRDLAPIVSKETETDADHRIETSKAASTPEQKILKGLLGGRWTLRSQSGIAKDTGLDPHEVGRFLEELIRDGNVARHTGTNGPRFFITEQGRSSLEDGLRKDSDLPATS
jgi:hypothetical protein